MHYITLPTTIPRLLCTYLFLNRHTKNCTRSGCGRRIVCNNCVYIASPNNHPKNILIFFPKNRSVVFYRRTFVQDQGEVDYSFGDLVYISSINNQPKNSLDIYLYQWIELVIVSDKNFAGSGSRISMLWDVNHTRVLCIYCKFKQPAQELSALFTSLFRNGQK